MASLIVLSDEVLLGCRESQAKLNLYGYCAFSLYHLVFRIRFV